MDSRESAVATIQYDLPWPKLASSVGLAPAQFKAAAECLDSGDTPWFIARYLRGTTGGLNEEQLLRVRDALAAVRSLESRKEAAIRGLHLQGHLPERVEKQLRSAATQVELSDMLLAHRGRKEESPESQGASEAMALLARQIRDAMIPPQELESRLASLVGQTAEWTTSDDVLAAAHNILVEEYGSSGLLRHRLRGLFASQAVLVVGPSTTPQGASQPTPKEYQPLLGVREALVKLSPYRMMFLLRGEREHHVSLKFDVDRAALSSAAYQTLVPPQHPHTTLLQHAADEAIERIILPALEKEARQELSELVLAHMQKVYGKTLRSLLMQRPLKDVTVLGVHYGHRLGSPIAVIGPGGEVLATDMVSIVPVADVRTPAKAALANVIREHGVKAIAIGGGIGKREIEEFVAETLREYLADVEVGYAFVNDGGLSAYASGAVGREDLPSLEPSQRAAVSIARRLIDAMNECLKIEPFNFGVGLYQQEVKCKELRPRLEDIAAECVNRVGLDVNRAPQGALRYIAGLNVSLARKISDLRSEQGPFDSRSLLLERTGMAPEEYRQCAGFLRIYGGSQPLDATSVHPMDYPDAEKVLEKLVAEMPQGSGLSIEEIAQFAQSITSAKRGEMAHALGLADARVSNLLHGISDTRFDPRDRNPVVTLRRSPLTPEDLTEGGMLNGSVVNVVDFGVFVDVGLRDSALVHVSHLSTKFIRDPHEFVCPGDPVQVWVTQINRDKGRISLTMIPPGQSGPGGERRGEREQGRKRPPRGRGGKPGTGPRGPKGPDQDPAGATQANQGAENATQHAAKAGQPMRSFAELHATLDEQRKRKREENRPENAAIDLSTLPRNDLPAAEPITTEGLSFEAGHTAQPGAPVSEEQDAGPAAS